MQQAVCVLTLPVFRCAIEDNSYAAIQVNGYANLTVNSSHISAGEHGIIVSMSEHGEEIWIPGSRVETSNVSVVVENTEIYGGRYGVRCYGRAIDCRVANSHLQLNLVRAVWCQDVRSCTVERCTMDSSHSYELAVQAVRVQTLVIDSSVIASKTSGHVVYASRCNSVQVRVFNISG